MPYIESPNLKPLNDDEIIFRYLTLNKFVSLIESSKLFLPSIPKARNVNDPSDGKMPSQNLSPKNPQIIESIIINKFVEQTEDSEFASFWRIGNEQSEEMWDEYTDKINKKGIAIQSTFGKLISSLENNQEEIKIGKVVYLEQNNQIQLTNAREAVFDGLKFNLQDKDLIYTAKNMSFSHEQELRILVSLADRSSCNEPEKSEWLKKMRDRHLFLNVNLDILVEKIYLHPKSLPEFKIEIISLLKQYKPTLINRL